MKFYHLLLMFFIGIILSSLLVIFWGHEGYFAFLKAKEHRQVLINNIEDLQKKYTQLQQEIKLLQSNPRVMKILARKLGYFGPGENIILLRGDLSFSNPYEIGNVVKTAEKANNRDPGLRIFGFSTGVFIIVMFHLIVQRKKHGRRV